MILSVGLLVGGGVAPAGAAPRGPQPYAATLKSQFLQGTTEKGESITTVYGETVGVGGITGELPSGTDMRLLWLNKPGASLPQVVGNTKVQSNGTYRFLDFEATSDQQEDNDPSTVSVREPRTLQVQTADGLVTSGNLTWTVNKSNTMVVGPSSPIVIAGQSTVPFQVTVKGVAPGGVSVPADPDGAEPYWPTGTVVFRGPKGTKLAEAPVNVANGKASASISINQPGTYKAQYIPDTTHSADPTMGWGDVRYNPSVGDIQVIAPVIPSSRTVPSLNPGQSVTSLNGAYRLTMQADGNLVVYRGNSPVWATMTSLENSYMRVQPDGNVVLYAPENDPLWNTGTYHSGNTTPKLQDDGNLVVYRSDGLAIWDSQGYIGAPSYRTTKRVLGGLGSGKALQSANGEFVLKMQADGNLVVYNATNGAAINWTMTTVPDTNLQVQADGNVVIYTRNGRAVWHTNTYGKAGAVLMFENDSNLVLYGTDGTALWDIKGFTGNSAVFL